MGFASPWFLGGLLAVGLPLYIHLLRQHKTTPLPFSSLMFFEKRTQSSVQHRRLKHLILLALRIALLCLLALAFANPFLNRSAAVGNDSQKLVIVAVDNSFSMRADGRLARARQEALSVLSELRPNDLGQVIAFSNQSGLVTEVVQDKPALQAAVTGIQQTDRRSSYGEIARTLRTIAQGKQIPVEAHVFSDMQKTSLPSPFSELSVASNTKLILHDVSSEIGPNWFVESVQSPRSVYEPKKVRVQATIAGTSGKPSEVPVTLMLGGRSLATKTVQIPASGRAQTEFYLPDAAYGWNRGSVQIRGSDKLPDDDAYPFAIERKETSRILFIHEARQARSLLYYRTAIDSASDAAFTVDALSPDAAANAGLNKYAAVVLADVGYIPESLESNLKKYVQGGGAALISLGSASATRQTVPVAGNEIVSARYAARSGERFQAAGSVDASHPVLSRVHAFEGAKFYQAVEVKPGKARVLARLANEVPLVLEAKLGEGRVLIFTSTFDNIANDLPLHASFVPFVERSARYLGGLEEAPAQHVVDSYLELRSAKDRGSAVEVIDPGGNRALSLQEAATAQTFRTASQGFYEIRRANGRNELAAVHADRRESNLETIPKETLALWGRAGDGVQAGGGGAFEQDSIRRQTFWRYFAMALLIVALTESIFAGRYLAPEPGEPAAARKAA